MKKKTILSLVLIFSVSWVLFYVLTMNARGLENYLRDFLPSRDIQISCEMGERTRAGYCTFHASAEEFLLIKNALRLVPELGKDIRGPSLCTMEGWNHLDDKVTLYLADPPLPPVEGNSHSYFIQLWYNTANGGACADMEYPYG